MTVEMTIYVRKIGTMPPLILIIKFTRTMNFRFYAP